MLGGGEGGEVGDLDDGAQFLRKVLATAVGGMDLSGAPTLPRLPGFSIEQLIADAVNPAKGCAGDIALVNYVKVRNLQLCPPCLLFLFLHAIARSIFRSLRSSTAAFRVIPSGTTCAVVSDSI